MNRRILVLVGVLFLALVGLVLIAGKQPAPQEVACISRQEVAAASERCLVIFEGKVYDVTEGKLWGVESGHLEGKHPCGKEYDAATIGQGPHGAEVMQPFYISNLCPEE